MFDVRIGKIVARCLSKNKPFILRSPDTNEKKNGTDTLLESQIVGRLIDGVKVWYGSCASRADGHSGSPDRPIRLQLQQVATNLQLEASLSEASPSPSSRHQQKGPCKHDRGCNQLISYSRNNRLV